MALTALKVSPQNYNSMQTGQQLAASNWTISEGEGNVPYVVGGGSQPYSGGIILIYKKNSNGEWEEYDSSWLRGSWTDCVSPWTSSSSAATKYYKCNLDVSNITVNDDGEYGILLGLESQSVSCSTNSIGSLLGLISATVDQAKPPTYTEIGSNGIVVYDGIHILKIDSNGIELKAKKSVGSDSFYGIKITSSGMYFSRGNNSWRDWDPS